MDLREKNDSQIEETGTTMNHELKDMMEDCPIIPAIKNMDGLQKCIESDSKIIFVLFGDLLTIANIVHTLKEAGKIVIVHLDLVTGLSAKEVSVDFIKNMTNADGVISTKQNLIKRAKELELMTIMRFFIIDSMALANVGKQVKAIRPDCIEVLPGVMPKIIQKIRKEVRMPVIAGGLISDKEDVMTALDAGAIAVSATGEEVWFL